MTSNRIQYYFLSPTLFIFIMSCGIFILSGCTGMKNSVDEKPIWITERPINPNYYIGISGVSKSEFPYNANEVAKENALNSLAREIRVQVNSTSLLSTLQVNKWVEESFASNIESTVAENLEGYNLIDEYETKDEVFVYYRLSKSEYARILENRKRVTLGVAYGHYLDASRKHVEGEISVAIERYLIGLDQMSGYLGELNPYTGEDGVEFDLDRALFNGLSDCISQLEISSTYDLDKIDISLGTGYIGEYSVKVTSKGKDIGGVSLNYSYSRGAIPVRGSTVTSGNGEAIISMNGFDPGTTRSELIVEVNLASLRSILSSTSPLVPLIKGMKSTPLRIPITLESPKIRVIGDEMMFGIQRGKVVLISALRAALSEQGVEIVEGSDIGSDALTLRVYSDTRIGGEGSGFYTAYLNATLELLGTDQELVMQKNIERIKGVQLDKERAGEEAYRKAVKEIEGRFIESFIKALYK